MAKTKKSNEPSQNVDSEIAVLGSIIQDKNSLFYAVEKLSIDDFIFSSHQIIFKACFDMFSKNVPIDILTLSEELERTGVLQDVGGRTYIVQLVDDVSSTTNVEHYVKIVKDKSILRSLVVISEGIKKSATEDMLEIDEILDGAVKGLFNISQDRFAYRLFPINDILQSSIKIIEEGCKKSKSGISGISTGYKDLDKITCGLHPNDLIILAGRPSSGKSSLALNLADHAATLHNKTVAIFSLEMSKEQLVQRMMCSKSKINLLRLRSGDLNDYDWKGLIEAAEQISLLPIFIDDTPDITMHEIRAKTRKLKMEKNLDMVIVDYLQLVRSSRRYESRQTEVSEISRTMKALAKELNVPVISLSQLSRKIEERIDPKPKLSDLRESGALEQDADLVLFIYRQQAYVPGVTGQDDNVEIIVAKQRSGPTGMARLVFYPEYTLFEDNAISYKITQKAKDVF